MLRLCNCQRTTESILNDDIALDAAALTILNAAPRSSCHVQALRQFFDCNKTLRYFDTIRLRFVVASASTQSDWAN